MITSLTSFDKCQKKLTRAVWAVQGIQKGIGSIFCYLSNKMMSLKATVRVAQSRGEGRICVS